MRRNRWVPLLGLMVVIALPAWGDGMGEEADGPRLETRLYGSVKLDAAYDTAQADPGNFVRWVDLFPQNPDDDRFNMTANQTRLGLLVTTAGGGKGEKAPGPEVSGRVEIDFFGGGAENKSNPLLRHAYVELAWPDGGWKLLAGQTSDVFSPLYPKTVNYSVAWWSGNIGYRRPQLRVSRSVAAVEASRVQLAAALARTIGDSFSEFASCDAGADSGLPGVQGRVGWVFDGPQRRRLAVGLSGHWAEEEYDRAPSGRATTFDSWSLNLDLAFDLGARARLQLEAWSGANLATYLGGIGQGVNLDAGVEIAARGGWLSLDLGPYDGVEVHLGAGLDDPDDADLSSGDRAENRNVFANAVWPLGRFTRLAVELSSWQTDYLDLGRADDFRTQLAVLFDF